MEEGAGTRCPLPVDVALCIAVFDGGTWSSRIVDAAPTVTRSAPLIPALQWE